MSRLDSHDDLDLITARMALVDTHACCAPILYYEGDYNLLLGDSISQVEFEAGVASVNAAMSFVLKGTQLALVIPVALIVIGLVLAALGLVRSSARRRGRMHCIRCGVTFGRALAWHDGGAAREHDGAGPARVA